MNYKLQTLKWHKDFNIVSKFGSVVFAHSMILQHVKLSFLTRNSSLDSLFYGVTISKKVGGAVVRNRVKRLLYVVIKTSLPILYQDLCYVIICRRKSVEKNLNELRKEFIFCVQKAHRSY